MASRLVEDSSLRNKLSVFSDRTDAGKQVASFLKRTISGDEIVLAIPSGGVPVAFEIAEELSLPMDLIIVRKIQIPWNTEAGFGAVDPDQCVIYNEELLRKLKLTEKVIKNQIEKTLAIIRERNKVFRKEMPIPELDGRRVIIVDDGLASGYTMVAAVRFARRRNPEKIIVAVPTGLGKTIDFVLSEADEFVCLNVRSGYSFAVADSYENWYDLGDKEVISILEKYYKKGIKEKSDF